MNIFLIYNIIDKKVDFQVLDNLEEIRNKWIEIFAGNLTERERKEISIDNHLWYAFNSEKKDYLEGEDAVEAFNNLRKKGYYVFFDYDRYDDRCCTYDEDYGTYGEEKLYGFTDDFETYWDSIYN